MPLLPAEKAEFVDTWNVVGMAGSASHDFTLKNQTVEEDYTAHIFDSTIHSSIDSRWLNIPFIGAASPTHSAVVIGIARGAVDEVVKLSTTKRSSFNPSTRLADDPMFLHKLGEADAKLYSLRAAVDRSIQDYAVYVEAQRPVPMADIVRCTALVSYTNHECLAIVNDLFSLMGGTPVYSRSALQRCSVAGAMYESRRNTSPAAWQITDITAR